MTNILFCTGGYFPDKTGGAEHQARLQAEELTRRGHSVTVVCPRRRGVRVSEVGGIAVHRLPAIHRRYLFELSYSFMLALFLARRIWRFELIHVHMAYADTGVVCLFARLTGRPVYVKIARGGVKADSTYLARHWILKKTALAYPQRFQCISNEIEEDLLRIGVAPKRLVRIPNGVDPGEAHEITAPEKFASRTRLGLPADAVIVLFLARFTRVKGLNALLEAWAEAPSGAVLVLVGHRPLDGPLFLADGRRVEDSELQSSVRIFDWTDTPGEFMAASDIFVLPSRSEGMSNSLLRAMSEGLAVIATRVGAAEEMIDDGEEGLLIPVDDARALATAMRTLVTDGALRSAMGAAARRKVEAEYSIGSVVERIEAEYRAILGR